MQYRVLNLGDRAVTFEFGALISKHVSQHVLGAHTQIKKGIARGALHGIIECVPSFRSLTVHFDPTLIFPENVATAIAPYLEEQQTAVRDVAHWSFPVCYAPELAPDIEEVAHKTGLTTEELIATHLATNYDVFMLGFLPGFAFMGLVSAPLHLPRRTQPRTAVPQGSVAIANQLTAIYPTESPGGWHLIGRTPISLFDVRWQQPVLLNAGDRVAFHQINTSEFTRIKTAIDAGTYDHHSECRVKGGA